MARASGSVPFSRIATGVSGARPSAISFSAMAVAVADAHVDDERAALAGKTRPVLLGETLALAGDEADRRGDVAVGERQHRAGRAAERRRHAGDDLDRKPGGAHRLDLLAATSEDERIAAFQPHDDGAGLDVRDDERVDRLLRHRVPGALLRDADAERGRGCEVEHAGIDETVVDEHIGLPKCARRLDGQQIGVAGPRRRRG